MTSISPFAAGLSCACPRCGKGPLFAGYLKLAPSCSVCGLDYAKADSGDGPAVFVIFVVGFLAVAIAFVARFVWDWSTASSLALAGVVIVAASFGLLRIFKATLIALQFKHDAAQGGPVE